MVFLSQSLFYWSLLYSLTRCCLSLTWVFVFSQSLTNSCSSLGDDNNGYNIPVIRACPEVADFLSQSEEELATTDLNHCTELVQRLLGDSYMCLYQSTDVLPESSMSTDVPVTTVWYLWTAVSLLSLLCHYITVADILRTLMFCWDTLFSLY